MGVGCFPIKPDNILKNLWASILKLQLINYQMNTQVLLIAILQDLRLQLIN